MFEHVYACVKPGTVCVYIDPLVMGDTLQSSQKKVNTALVAAS